MEVPNTVSAKKRKRNPNSADRRFDTVQDRRRKVRERVRKHRRMKEEKRRRALMEPSSESEDKGNDSDSQVVIRTFSSLRRRGT